jgi:predicted transcriptional regulator
MARARVSWRKTDDHGGMGRESVTFRLDAAKRAELDALARVLDRDRSCLLGEAVDAHLEVHRWQIAQIEAAIRETDAGTFASDEEVEAAYARWTG